MFIELHQVETPLSYKTDIQKFEVILIGCGRAKVLLVPLHESQKTQNSDK